ncbi:MAG: sulfotransferase domain-containing protein [Gemmata sp.]
MLVSGDWPSTVFHVTHWKAGSQWIKHILQECCPDLIVRPAPKQVQYLGEGLKAGKVYPTVYLTKGQFESISRPPGSCHFVVIRDLRDTLVSAYFSILYSHWGHDPELLQWRQTLQKLSPEEGFARLLEEWLYGCEEIQRSWLEAGEQLFRYEDLLERDLDILEPVLIDRCRLPVSRERFREVILGARFDRRTEGRKRGEEDLLAHERKGVAGDWRNYFTPGLARLFRDRFGETLVATGYEPDDGWVGRVTQSVVRAPAHCRGCEQRAQTITSLQGVCDERLVVIEEQAREIAMLREVCAERLALIEQQAQEAARLREVCAERTAKAERFRATA